MATNHKSGRPGSPPTIISPAQLLLWLGPNALVFTCVLALARAIFGHVPVPGAVVAGAFLGGQFAVAFRRRRDLDLETAREFMKLAAVFGALYALALASLCIAMR